MFGFFIGTLSLIGFIKVLRGGDRWGRGRGGPRRWMMRRLFQHLDTTPGQEKVIASAVDNAQRLASSTREQLFRSRSDFAKAMRGETFDTAQVNQTFEAQQSAIDEMKSAVREGMQQIHEALTPDQRNRLGDLIEFGPRVLRDGHGHGHWGGGHFAHRHHGFRSSGGESVNL